MKLGKYCNKPMTPKAFFSFISVSFQGYLMIFFFLVLAITPRFFKKLPKKGHFSRNKTENVNILIPLYIFVDRNRRRKIYVLFWKIDYTVLSHKHSSMTEHYHDIWL